MSSLVYKREYVETSPRRPVNIWLMDISKQGISSVIIHFCNIGLSILFAKLSLTPERSSDECAFYFLSFVLDTIVGVYLIFVGLGVVQKLALQFEIKSIQMQGFYGFEQPLTFYTHQLIVYIVIILLSKIILGVVEFIFCTQINELGNFIFEPLKNQPDLELVVVMVLAPCFLSSIQYWIQDNMLMNKEINRDNYVYLEDRDRDVKLSSNF